MRPLHYYLAGTSSWFLAFGMQSVMFAWLVTIVLRETPEKVGIAQMTLLLPGLLLMLIGGGIADRYGGARVALAAQLFSVIAPAFLIGTLLVGELTFDAMLIYAVIMGLAQAFVTPARDGLLNHVAEGRIQRTVMLTSVCQFGLQILGFGLASMADTVGAVMVLGAQSLVLLFGALAFSRIHLPITEHHGERPSLRQLIAEGAATVARIPPMRAVVLQNIAMGVCFMGSYMVTMPILVREVFNGTSADLGMMNAANSVGLVSMILVLLRVGDLERQGRALIISQALGGFALIWAGVVESFAAYAIVVFVWGVCGGAAMTMSRTIMQEQAPETQRGRVMSFYSLSFMGSGTIGALAQGLLVDWVGPQTAIIGSSVAMIVCSLVMAAFSSLWRLGHTPYVAEQAA